MTVLVLLSEATGTAWRVWPDPEPIAPGAVHETGSYLFELRDSAEASQADLVIDDLPLEALRAPAPDAARWRWSPGFHAGTAEAELRVPGRTARRFEIITDPDRRKLARDEFDVMVQEILADTFALFSVSAFHKSVARGFGEKPPAIARLEFLRSRIEELESVVEAIVKSPRRRLSAEQDVLPYHRASRATGLEIVRSLRSGRVLEERVKPTQLPRALKGFLPERIRTSRRVSSLDLLEHRQMGACLRYWRAWLDGAAERLGRGSVGADSEMRRRCAAWALRCRRLARRVAKLATATPFAEVGDARPHLTLSAVFRNDPVYRRFYRLWQDMNLGIASIFGDYLNLPIARTYELYELWCFLRLLHGAAEEFGTSNIETKDLFITDASGGLTLASGTVTVTVSEGLKLCFQKQYKEFWIEPDEQGSYSRAMTPDVVAAVESSEPGKTEQLIVLDAKYRIDDGLNEALNSIHTYRDALVREARTGKIEGIVTAAYLLSPAMPTLGASFRDTSLPGRLFHPEYRGTFRFGAVTLKPGMSIQHIRTALRTLLTDAIDPPSS
ncbi:DUF2357 domain-containing protein [Bradyrhizobium sp. SZCCHNS2005]|uniref:DUF2357 domain-containing protein n=1 Tax=Bradyrhizobium sp. SZCCHNS2005 TaxID=3057303 RepID=UPI0028E7A3D2|nr:DUF2357 domain-containing protein [Bradyrhizobium sp. SZCCHNS2005]